MASANRTRAAQADQAVFISAVGYIRMSSAKQDKSPDQQRDEINKLAKHDGYTVARWYADPGISGDEIEARPQFCEMLADVVNGGPKTILAWDQDRFGRFDSLDAGSVLKPLREAGVRLVTCTQGPMDWDTFEGRVSYMVRQEGKHQYQRDVSKNSLRGKVAAVQTQFSHGMPAYAYDRLYYDEAGQFIKRVLWNHKFTRPDKWTCQLEPSQDHNAVAFIRWAFSEFVQRDTSLSAICREAGRRGIPTRRGGPWCVGSLRKILTNPIYIGHQTFGNMARGKFNRVGEGGELIKVAWFDRKRREFREKPLLVRKNAHQAIIDQDTFDAVQVKLLERGKGLHKPKDKSAYLLGGLVRCGHCGQPMVGLKNQVGTRYYRCNGDHGKCKRRSIRQDQIETAIIAEIQNRVLAPEAVDELRQELLRRLSTRSKSRKPEQDAKRIKAQLTALDAKITRGTENLLLADAENIPDMQRMLAGWRAERDGLRTQLDAAEQPQASGEAISTVEACMAKLTRLQEAFQSADPATVRNGIRGIVGTITVWWDAAKERAYQFQKMIVEPCRLIDSAPGRS